MLLKYNKAGIHHISPLMFKPGVNDVDTAQWNMVKDHPDVKQMLVDGELEVISKKESGPVKSLKEFKPEAAIKLAKATYDHELLVSWYKEESRAKVCTALEEQLKQLDLDTDGKPLEERESA